LSLAKLFSLSGFVAEFFALSDVLHFIEGNVFVIKSLYVYSVEKAVLENGVRVVVT